MCVCFFRCARLFSLSLRVGVSLTIIRALCEVCCVCAVFEFLNLLFSSLGSSCNFGFWAKEKAFVYLGTKTSILSYNILFEGTERYPWW